MAGQQNRLSRFWHELKRRRVIHVITVYASASFAVIEIVNNLTGPLNLPTSLSTIVIIVLAVGFPPAIILSWLYDLTSGTFERTKPLVGAEEEVKPATVPNAWKIATYVSFVVIIGLATLNIIGNGNKLRARDIRSLVILPFENFTGDERMDNMVSSMHSLMIGDMGRISGLRVIGKTSSQVFKDSGKSAKEIARELNVDGVVEATVTCLGDSICMQFRLLDTKGDERQIWVGDYHEDKGQILNMYNRITQLITKEVRIELTEDEKQKLAEKRTLDREAVTAFLKSYVTDLSEESLRKAEDFLNQAVKKDPEWALPYLLLAGTWSSMTQMGYEPPDL
jgi:TolB-like protein